MNKNLVIVRAGKASRHEAWPRDGRTFDLLVSAYEELPAALTANADEAVLIPGSKVASWQALFAARPDLLSRYDQFALLDDDLICTVGDINAAFAAGGTYHLALWQPSLSWDSYFSYASCLHNPLFALRYVNFVEMMCAFFSADHLARALPLFALGYETNIDRLWCRLRVDWREAYAVLDSVQFRHARPVGQNAAAQGFLADPSAADGNMYQSAIDRIEARQNIYFRGPVAYAGLTQGGRKISGRWRMAVLSAVLLLGWRRRVNRRFYRPVLDHIRHNLTRPIDNQMLDVAVISARAGAP